LFLTLCYQLYMSRICVSPSRSGPGTCSTSSRAAPCRSARSRLAMPITMSRRGGFVTIRPPNPSCRPACASRRPSAPEERRPTAMRYAGRSSLILSADIGSIHVSVCWWATRSVVGLQPIRCSARPMRLVRYPINLGPGIGLSGGGLGPIERRLAGQSISRRRRKDIRWGLAKQSAGRDRSAAQAADCTAKGGSALAARSSR
jgi:hypothetical protein